MPVPPGDAEDVIGLARVILLLIALVPPPSPEGPPGRSSDQATAGQSRQGREPVTTVKKTGRRHRSFATEAARKKPLPALQIKLERDLRLGP